MQTKEIVDPITEEEKEILSVGYEAARTPSGLTYDNERGDICKWAVAQKDYKETSYAPATAFHAYFGKRTEAWCQMFMNWCSVMAGVPASNFSRGAFDCQTCLSGYGSSRRATKSSSPEAGWLLYETYGSKPNHVGMYVGNGQYAHGNYNTYYVRVISSCYGTFVSYAKPYYRSKVYYNTNQSGASYNGYTYPNMYSTWYTEEQAYTLSSSGPTCSGKSFQGWYTTSACTNRITSISTSTRGPVYAYAKWSGGDGGGGSTPPPIYTSPPVVVTQTPTAPPTPTPEPIIYWSINHVINGGYFTGTYPTYYRQGVGCTIPQNNAARTGYTFNGWYDYSYGYRYRIYASDVGDKTLYAQWTANKYPLYLYTQTGKVTTGGYSFTDLGNKYYRYNKNYTYDTVEYLPTQPSGIDRRGHDFKGWYKDSGFSNGPYTNLPKGTIGTQIYYAKWTPKVYRLILHKNGGTVVNTRIDNGKVIGDDIIGNYTYSKGSTFPKANTDIYKKDRIFQGWYENSGLSGTPQTGIRTGDDDTAPIGDKEFWARWLEIKANPSKNEATELINNKLTLYVYYTYKITSDDGKGVQRESTPTAENKRYFCVDLKPDPSSSASSAVKVWVSTDSNPDSSSSSGRLTNFTITSTKSISGSSGLYSTYDNSTLTIKCPSNIESFIESDGHAGSRKVYVHVETVTGNRGVHEVNIVKRALYAQH